MRKLLARGRFLCGWLTLILSGTLPVAAASEARRPAILVQDFVNRSYDIRHDWVGIGLAYLVRKDLATLGTLHLLEDRRAKPGEAEPIADYLIDGEVRMDEVDRGGDGKFVVFVTLDRLGAEAVRRQFLTEGAPSQLFDMAEYLTERIARHLGFQLGPGDKLRFRAAMTQNLAAFQQFSEAMVERRIHVKIEAYERAIQLDPEFAEAHFHLGRVHTVLRDYEAAERNLERAVELSPGFADAHNDLGYVLAQQGKLDAARASYEGAVAADPREPRYLLNLGDLLRQSGRPLEAKEAYEAVLALAPGQVEAVAALARSSGGLPTASAVATLTTPTPAAVRPQVATPTPVAPAIPVVTAAPPLPAPSATPMPIASPTPVEAVPPPSAASVVSRPEVAPASPDLPATPPPLPSPQLDDRALKELQLAHAGVKRVRGDRDAALARLKEADEAAADGSRGRLYLALGHFYLSQNLNHAAVDALEIAVSTSDVSAEMRAALADAYTRIGKRAAAEKERASSR